MARQRDLFVNAAPPPELRPYQHDGVTRMRALVERGARRVLLTMPTGGGKTVVAAHIIAAARRLDKRVLFVAHRVELINQTARQLARFGVTDIGVIRGTDKRADESAPVQVASIDTLRNRAKPDAAIIFVDECHRAVAESYLALFAHYPDALHIGLTASPFRANNTGLGEIYQELVICATPSQLIADGFIVEPSMFAAPELPDLSGVEYSVMADDYHDGQLGAAMMRGRLVGNIVEEWREKAGGRRTVVFAVNVEHSKTICAAFNDAGIRAAHIDGTTSEDERGETLLKLEKAAILIVCNCDVLSEGWDQPSVKCAVLARPTSSLRLHIQQTGRVLRPWDVSKDQFCDAPPGCVVLDHAGNIERHGAPTQDREFGLSGIPSRQRVEQVILHTCAACYAMWTSAATDCPSCGKQREIRERKPIQHDESIQLLPVDPTKIFTKADEERQFFIKQIARCKENGMKPGAAAHKFKEKYKRWPPYSWSQQAKAMFNADAAWQHEMQRRTQAREFWTQRQTDQKQAEPPIGGGNALEEEAQDDTDAWWSQFRNSNENLRKEQQADAEIEDDDIPF